MMLTPETVQGGQDAVPGYGCNRPPTRLVLPPWFPNWPLTNRASWSGAARSTGYELAGHGRPEQRGTALDWTRNAKTVVPTSIKSFSRAPAAAPPEHRKSPSGREPQHGGRRARASRPRPITGHATAPEHSKGRPPSPPRPLHPQC